MSPPQTTAPSRDNKADYGGGIYSKGDVTVTDSTISSNEATEKGGGIRIWGDYDLELSGYVTIENNTQQAQAHSGMLKAELSPPMVRHYRTRTVLITQVLTVSKPSPLTH